MGSACLVTRVAGAAGWFVHGFVLEFQDHSRRGRLCAVKGAELDIRDDELLQKRYARWESIMSGEFIEAVEWCCCTGQYTRYLAGSLSLQTSLGRALEFPGVNRNEFGGRFSVAAPAGMHIVNIIFQDGGST